MSAGRAGLVLVVACLASVFLIAPSSAQAAGSYPLIADGEAMCPLGELEETAGSAFAYGCSSSVVSMTSPSVQTNAGDRGIFQVVSPSSALNITSASITEGSYTFRDGYTGAMYWSGGGSGWPISEATTPFAAPSSYWGIQLVCGDANYCAGEPTDEAAELNVTDFTLQVSETQAPSLAGTGLWGQSEWVWNATGDPWPLAVNGTDPSGVCTSTLDVNGQQVAQEQESQNVSTWTQCPSPLIDSVNVDTGHYVPTSGMLTLATSASNAAQNPASASSTVEVDNVQPTVTIAPQNASDPAGAGDITITPTAGPSGISSVSCTQDGQSLSLPSPNSSGQYLLTISDSASHQIVCTVANNAVNPQGAHNTGTATYTVRAATTSEASFAKVIDPRVVEKVRERVRVGGHEVTRVRHGKKVRLRVGGHLVTRTVIKRVERCRTERVKVRVRVKVREHGRTRIEIRRRLERRKVCLRPRVVYDPVAHVPYGKAVTIYGQLNGPNGPVSGQSVTIAAAPLGTSTPATTIGTATTDSSGGWSARIPAGPSRSITATYAGDGTLLPATGTVTTKVLARVHLIVTRGKDGALDVSGHLDGGYVPPEGVAMRLLIDYRGVPNLVDAHTFRTNDRGQFAFAYFPPAVGAPYVVGLAVGLDGNEDDYPFAANRSPLTKITTAKARKKPKKRH